MYEIDDRMNMNEQYVYICYICILYIIYNWWWHSEIPKTRHPTWNPWKSLRHSKKRSKGHGSAFTKCRVGVPMCITNHIDSIRQPLRSYGKSFSHVYKLYKIIRVLGENKENTQILRLEVTEVFFQHMVFGCIWYIASTHQLDCLCESREVCTLTKGIVHLDKIQCMLGFGFMGHLGPKLDEGNKCRKKP